MLFYFFKRDLKKHVQNVCYRNQHEGIKPLLFICMFQSSKKLVITRIIRDALQDGVYGSRCTHVKSDPNPISIVKKIARKYNIYLDEYNRKSLTLIRIEAALIMLRRRIKR